MFDHTHGKEIRPSLNLPSAALSYSHISYHWILREEVSNSLSPSSGICYSQDMPSSPISSFVALLWRHLSTLKPLHCGTQDCTQHSRWGFTNAEIQWDYHLYWLSVLRLMHPRMWFALLAARKHNCLILSLPLASIPRPFSAGLLSRHSSPSLYVFCATLS